MCTPLHTLLTLTYYGGRIKFNVVTGTYVFTLWLSALCMRSKAWLATPRLLAHAEVTKTFYIFFNGPTTQVPHGITLTYDGRRIHVVRDTLQQRLQGCHCLNSKDWPERRVETKVHDSRADLGRTHSCT